MINQNPAEISKLLKNYLPFGTKWKEEILLLPKDAFVWRNV